MTECLNVECSLYPADSQRYKLVASHLYQFFSGIPNDYYDGYFIDIIYILSDTLPKYGQALHSDFFHRLQDENNNEQKSVVINTKKMFLWETTGLVWGKDGFCGNFFGATMKPKHPSGGSSGSPIYDDNIVYGILHNGGEDFCGFYSSTHALKLLRQYLSK